MTKRTIEIEDDLQERIDGAVDQIVDRAKEYVKDNPDKEYDGICDLIDDLDYDGTVHEIIDSYVPIYHYNINGLWYLYSDDFQQAYRDYGIGDGTEDNYPQSAIWCYIDRAVHQELSDNEELQNIVDDTQL